MGLCPTCLLARTVATVRTTASPSQAEPGELSSGRGGFLTFDPPSAENLAAMLPGYDVLEVIGRGGMGVVYRGRQRRLNRDVAIKVLPAKVESELQFHLRFEREARAMAALQHPNIVTVHDFGEATDDTHTVWLYFVMEFVDGTDLLHLLRSGTMGPDLCMRVVLAVCDALQFAHDHGIIHRDIKPANILVHRHGEVKVADFGLAKVMGAEIARQGASHAPLLTLTAISMGTPGYVAPETLQHGSQATDHRADIYAIGVLLYELLTHSIPLGSFELPSKARPDLQINPAVDEVVVRAMRPDPEARYQRASELSRDITAILSGQQTTRLPAGPSPAGSWRETAVRFVPAALAVSFALTDLEFYPRHPGNAFAWKVVASLFPSLFLASVGPREMVEDGGLLVRWFGLRPSVQMSVLSGLAWLALGVVCGFIVQEGLLQPGFVENLVYGIGWTGLMASIGIFCFIAFYRSARASQPS